MSVWPLVVLQAMDLWLDHRPRHDPWQQPGLRYHHGPSWQCSSVRSAWTRWQSGPQTPTGPQGWVQPPGIQAAFNGNRSLGHQHRSWLQQRHRPRHGPCCNSGPYVTWILGDSICLSCLFGPSSSTALRHQEGRRLRPRYWTSVRTLEVTESTNISADSGCSRTMKTTAQTRTVDIADHQIAWPK